MTGVVVIHAMEDAAPAHALGAKLRALGYEVALDLTPGRGLREAVLDADAVVGLWSPRSIMNEGLVTEAGFARGMGRLIHARMHNTPPPGDFARDPAIDLTGWRGEETFPGWLNLRAAVEGVVAAVYGEPAGPIDFGEPAEPRKLSEREHRERELALRAEEQAAEEHERAQRDYARIYAPPGYRDERVSAPPSYREQRAPRASYPAEPGVGGSPLRLAAIGLVTFVVVAGVGIGAYSMIEGGQTAAAAAAGWANLDKSNPLAISAFLDGNPGEFRQEAEAALDGLEVEAWGQAQQTDTLDAFQRFLTNFPQSRHRAEANGRMAMIRQRTRDQASLPVEPPKPIDEQALPVGGPAADVVTTSPAPALEDDDGLSDGPVQLTPPPDDGEEPVSTEEQLRRQITGEDRALGENELRLQVQGRE